MAQRGEIQCAERQFALQSSRHQKLRKFQTGRYLAEETHPRLPLFVFPVGHPKASDEIRREDFFFRSDCRAALEIHRKDNKNESEQNVDKADNDVVCNGGLHSGWIR